MSERANLSLPPLHRRRGCGGEQERRKGGGGELHGWGGMLGWEVGWGGMLGFKLQTDGDRKCFEK